MPVLMGIGGFFVTVFWAALYYLAIRWLSSATVRGACVPSAVVEPGA